MNLVAGSTKATTFFFFQVSNNHILSILIITSVFGFLYWKKHSLKSAIFLTFAFGLIHECLFGIFATLDYPLLPESKFAYSFIMVLGLYVSYTMFLKKTLLVRQYVGLLGIYFLYLIFWQLNGFHLSHNVFTGAQTIYYNDPITALFEICSWLVLGIAFCLSISKFRKVKS